MTTKDKNQKAFDYATEIWNIADYVRDVIKPKDYNRVILPFALLRRLECALEPTRDKVCEAFKANEKDWGRENENYCTFSGKAFYNITAFRLNNLGAISTFDALKAYIDGFSPNAREIMEKFKMDETCKTLDSKGMLYEVCQRFSAFDLSPENVSDREMSNIYEHLIEKFGEAIAEDAEDFMTPKDVVRLAVGMIFANDDELMNSDTGIVRTLYDPTMGTGGFITDALDLLDEWHEDKKMKAPAQIVCYGQEIEDESWAMGKANLLIRNVSNDDKDEADAMKDMSAHILQGDTLAEDKFEDMTFDYQLSNPPYGKKWEKSEAAVKEEAAKGFKGRYGAGLPAISDGSMLFMQHVIAKMKPKAQGGGKAGIVLSGSPLFTDTAGSSDIRRWMFKEDVIDCIVKLPEQIFYRTGINTYLWIFNNNKPLGRQGMIQLIDASDCKTQLRKNQGKKRFEISEPQRNWIVETYIDGHDHGKSVLVPVEDFMYRQVTTQRPLRMMLKIDEAKFDDFTNALSGLTENDKNILKTELMAYNDKKMPYSWADDFAKDSRKKLAEAPKKLTANNIAKALRDTFGVKSEEYDIVKDKKGNVIYDSELKDTENIPFDIAFEEYMNKEVLPYASDTIIDDTVLDTGPLQDGNIGVVKTNISFNKYFYHYEEPRKPEIIAKEIEELENGLSNFLRGVFDD